MASVELLSGHTGITLVVYLAVVFFYCCYAIGVYAVFKKFFPLLKAHAQLWEKYIEFPIINHTFHVLRKYYVSSISINLSLLSIFGSYMALSSRGASTAIPMIAGVIVGIMALVYSYIVVMFSQAHQVMIALEIIKDSRDEDHLNTNQIVAKQMEKKNQMRTIYQILGAKDAILTVGFVVIHLIQDDTSTHYIQFAYFSTIISTLLFFAVPLATIYRFIKNRELTTARPTRNPLRRIIHAHGVATTVFVLVITTILIALALLDIFTFVIIPYISILCGTFFPLIIMLVTMSCCTNIEQENSNAPIDLCNIEPGVVKAPLEKPPPYQRF